MFSRGKLPFLSLKDDRIKLINERINLTEKHIIEICESFSTCTRKLAKYRNAYDELATKLYNYGEEEELNQSLMDGLKKMSNAVLILADHMDLNVQRLEFKIVNELALFDTLCKSTRDNLRMAVNIRDKEVYKQKQMLQIKSKFSTNHASTDSELLKAKMEVNRTNKEIDKIIINFEKRKLCDLKAILIDFILITMKCHVKSLEVLSDCYNNVNRIDEIDDLRIFRKIMKTKWDDIDMITQKKNKNKSLSKSMESLNYEASSSPLRIDKKLSSSVKSLGEMEKDSNSMEDEDNDENDNDDDDEIDDDDGNLSETDEKDENTENDDDITNSRKFTSTDNIKKEHSTTKNKYESKRQSNEDNMNVKRHPFKAAGTSLHALNAVESKSIKQPHDNVFLVTNTEKNNIRDTTHNNSKAKDASANKNKHIDQTNILKEKSKEFIRRESSSNMNHQVTFVESNKMEDKTRNY